MQKRTLLALGLVLVGGLAALGVRAGAGSGNDWNPNPFTEKVGSGSTKGMPATAQALYAVINADGTKARTFQGDTSQRLAEGQYEVIFKQRVDFCAFVASVGSSASSGTEPAGYATTVRRSGNINGVFVATFDTDGVQTDRGFHLIVTC